ncbi:MAG TPA: hypothetical protein VGO11_16670 [Chthoniobacteraceae bacterium]|jgi:hypothetical protein|nr:hypothetical protein [Chthoniobacteraceae bacterium]
MNNNTTLLLTLSIASLLLSACAPEPPARAITVTAHLKGESAPTTYTVTANQVTATRHNPNGTVTSGTGRNMQEAMANMKTR